MRGWGGSLPVRVGNDAGDKVKFDALGMVVEAVSVHLQTGGGLDRRRETRASRRGRRYSHSR